MVVILDLDLLDSTIELPKLTDINNHTIDLEKDKQIFFGLVYKLGRAKNSENSH